MSQPTQPPNTQSNSNSNSNSGSIISTTSITQTAAVGGLTFTQPPHTAAASFYKIAPSQLITFGWNFTSLLSMPTHLTISAVGANEITYPVGPTDGITFGDAGGLGCYSYQQANPTWPLSPQTYALKIWDDRGPNAPRAPGLFQENTEMTFAMYLPRPYTHSLVSSNLFVTVGWSCTGCQNVSIFSYATHPAFAATLASIFVVLLSGSWLSRPR
ncbi:hypothetical protein BD410DRAFT_777477 [Rickenella mellea]|uniref:DUF7137 domain-containing protein n=1 Tax=Rickenella mellea TaxID=50990 RepID=A0A4Y7PLR8_9AGAM|nr:hypothetical protein BD410DRAFT_777477 [Rickenella mellea]